MRASVQTVSPDRKYRSRQLRFGDEFRRALEYFQHNGIEVREFEGDWSYMTKDEVSANLEAFREAMAAGATREEAAKGTPTGKVATKYDFELINVENVLESQPHLAAAGIRRWRVKAVFRRNLASGGGTPAGSTGAKETETTSVESGTGMASRAIAPQPPTQFSTGMRVSAGVLGVLTVASEIMGSIARVQDVQRSYNARMEATVRFFNEFGGKPQFVMVDVDTGVQQPSGTTSDTGAVWGRWVAPRLESVNVQALLAALPGRLTTMQSLVEFLGTGRMLQVIEQRGAHYYLTGKGVGYVEITDAIERIRSNLMRGLDERARAQMASKGGAGVYRIRSSDVTIYRYAKGVREPWRVRHIEVPIITTPEFSGANMWVREVGDKGDRVHVEPANAEAEGLAQNAWYIVPKAVGDVYDEVEDSGRTITSRQPADGPLEGFIAAPFPPELGYTRYVKHPNPDWREFTIAIGDLRQFWVDRDDLEPVSADQVAAYARGTPTAPPPSHFFRSEERRDLPGS
jgi:hypothetical protein